MSESNVPAENLNQAEEVALETTEETVDNSQNETTESIEDLRARLAEVEDAKTKAEELARNQKIRAEKAEKLAKIQKGEVKQEVSKPVSMSTKDYIALVNAKINEDDIVEVEDYAKFRGISIAEALKSSVVKTLLAEKEEIRKSAQATNTGNARRGSVSVSSDVLLSKAKRGDLPESEDDIMKLVRARKNYTK